MNESIRSGMAVLDVTLPTGYWIQQQKLDSYILSRRVRNLQRARYLPNKVLFYFDFVSIEKKFNDCEEILISLLLPFYSSIMKIPV